MKILPVITTDILEFCSLNNFTISDTIKAVKEFRSGDFTGICSPFGIMYIKILHPILLLHEMLHHIVFQLKLPKFLHNVIDYKLWNR